MTTGPGVTDSVREHPMTTEEMLAIALREAVIDALMQARFGSTLHWVKVHAVRTVLGCPRCGREAGVQCRNLRSRVEEDLDSDVHPDRLRQPAGAAICEAVDAIYAAARAVR